MLEGKGKTSRKGLKICWISTLILLIILIVVSISLFFTVFKPKQPQVSAHPSKLENIEVQIIPTLSVNATIGLAITVNNQNYGSFSYENTRAYIAYHGSTIAQVSIEHDIVPARGKVNITTYANITGEKLVSNPNFLKDYTSGRLNMTSWAALHGKVNLLNVFKLDAKVLTTCDISIIIEPQGLDFKCKSKIKL